MHFYKLSRRSKGLHKWFVEPGDRRCIVSRDVIFNEQVMGCKSSEQPQDLDCDISQDITGVEVETQDVNLVQEDTLSTLIR